MTHPCAAQVSSVRLSYHEGSKHRAGGTDVVVSHLLRLPSASPISTRWPQAAMVVLCTSPLLSMPQLGLLGLQSVTCKEKKRKEKFTLFSDHDGSLLRRQPGALSPECSRGTVSHGASNAQCGVVPTTLNPNYLLHKTCCLAITHPSCHAPTHTCMQACF